MLLVWSGNMGFCYPQSPVQTNRHNYSDNR